MNFLVQGFLMLRKMGWSKGALGDESRKGLVHPIDPLESSPVRRRSGLGNIPNRRSKQRFPEVSSHDIRHDSAHFQDRPISSELSDESESNDGDNAGQYQWAHTPLTAVISQHLKEMPAAVRIALHSTLRSRANRLRLPFWVFKEMWRFRTGSEDDSLPLPSVRRTRAIDVLRRPVPVKMLARVLMFRRRS